MKYLLIFILILGLASIVGSEPRLRTVLKSKHLVREVQSFFDTITDQLKENLHAQISLTEVDSSDRTLKMQLLEKQFRRLLGKRSNSQNKIDLPLENLGIFQAFIDQLHRNNNEPSTEQLDFLKNLKFAFEAGYNSTTKEEMLLKPCQQELAKTDRARQSCLKAIKEFSQPLLKNSSLKPLMVPAELLVHARQRQESPEKKGGSPRDITTQKSPRASPVRHRSGTVSIEKKPYK